MCLESTQLLCTAALQLRLTTQVPYKPTHAGHPCTLWTAAAPENAAWLIEHTRQLFDEYTVRYDREHRSEAAFDVVSRAFPHADWRGHTAFAQCMPDEWKHPDAVTAYRCFYIAVKSRFARWMPRARPPVWWPQTLIC